MQNFQKDILVDKNQLRIAMKNKKFFILICLIFLFSFTPILNAQEDESSEKELKWSGYFQTDNRLLLENGNKFSWKEYRLDLKAEVKPLEKVHFYSELWVRSLGFSNVQSSIDLVDRNKISPWDLVIKEAYVDLLGVVSDNIDIRIGKQRVAWGTGDKLNPTDNLNPNDLEDIWDFGRHLGSDGIKISFYPGDFTIVLVYFPQFTPSILPLGDLAAALSPSGDLPDGIIVGNLSDKIILPENNIKEGSITGIKVSKSILDFDLSLSYVHTRDSLPLLNKSVLTPTAIPGTVDIYSELIFPELNIVGADLAGALGQIGVWAEVAVTFPEEIMMISDLTSLGMGMFDSIALDNKPYVKYVIGADYTFKNGIYLNFQYLHGFVHERGAENLEDYFMFGMEWELMDKKIKIMPLTGGIEIKDFKDLKNNYAFIYSPSITFKPIDNIEISLGIRLLDGKDSTVFGKVKDLDEVFFGLKFNF